MQAREQSYRLYSCQGCSVSVSICGRCDHGNIFCAGECATVSTNKPFGECNQVFPNAGCVVTLVDRLMHKAEILTLAGKSYRLKEAQERAARNAKSRANKKPTKA